MTERYLPPIPHAIAWLLALIGGEKTKKLYLEWMSLVNYTLVMAVAYVIYVGLTRAVRLLALGWIGDALAVVLAFYWSWSQTVGPFGWVWGFSYGRKESEA